MQFHISTETYRVRINEDRLFHNGKECLGLAIYHAREILLSPALPPAQRLTTLLHELRHAWQFHFPATCATAEEEAVLSATIMKSTLMDLNAQGGARTLERLQYIPDPQVDDDDEPLPGREPEPPTVTEPRFVPADQVEEHESPAMSRAGRAECGQCTLLIADGSIVTGPVHWDHEAKGVTVHRQLFCPHCYCVQEWDEGATLAGVPNGAVVRGPEYMTGADVEAFLQKHPAAVGMISA